MSAHATGTFEVKLTPQAVNDQEKSADLGRIVFDKQFHGGIEATSKGEMLTTGSAKESGAYVALERVTGAVNGRSGSFVLRHLGIMTRGTPYLTIAVVPESGTGQLVGITGTMTITIADGKHSYDFEYTLPEGH